MFNAIFINFTNRLVCLNFRGLLSITNFLTLFCVCCNGFASLENVLLRLIILRSYIWLLFHVLGNYFVLLHTKFLRYSLQTLTGVQISHEILISCLVFLMITNNAFPPPPLHSSSRFCRSLRNLPSLICFWRSKEETKKRNSRLRFIRMMKVTSILIRWYLTMLEILLMMR